MFFGRKNKATWTMVMQVANAHSFSISFVGIQLTHGYVAALGLSSLCVIVGMIVSLLPDVQNNLAFAIPSGLLLGGIIAFVYDAMTVFGLKMVRESRGWKRLFAVVLTSGGILLSTMSGDTMWGLVYHDLRSLVLAASVSCMIIAVEVWAPEHTQAVKKASKPNGAMQTALNTEVAVIIDKMLRDQTHSMLRSPEVQEDLRKQSEASVRQIVQAKFKSRLSSFGGDSSSEERPKQLGSGRRQNFYRDNEQEFCEYMQANPDATLGMIMDRFHISESTAGDWRSYYRKNATKAPNDSEREQVIEAEITNLDD